MPPHCKPVATREKNSACRQACQQVMTPGAGVTRNIFDLLTPEVRARVVYVENKARFTKHCARRLRATTWPR
eukprot:8665826-Lingulodinium_polyedra.AAC.1